MLPILFYLFLALFNAWGNIFDELTVGAIFLDAMLRKIRVLMYCSI